MKFPTSCHLLGCVPALLIACLAFAGCDSASDVAQNVRTKLVPSEKPRVRVFTASQRATYEAAVRAAKDMSFRFIGGGPAEGRLEELSGIDSAGPAFGGSRQVALSAHLETTVDGTEVSVSFKEIVQDDPGKQTGFATETPMADTPLYEVFFRGIQQQLDAAKMSK